MTSHIYYDTCIYYYYVVVVPYHMYYMYYYSLVYTIKLYPSRYNKIKKRKKIYYFLKVRVTRASQLKFFSSSIFVLLNLNVLVAMSNERSEPVGRLHCVSVLSIREEIQTIENITEYIRPMFQMGNVWVVKTSSTRVQAG